MRHDRQLAAEAVKAKLYALMLEQPCTRRMLMKGANITKVQLANHLQRMIVAGHVKAHPVKVMATGYQGAKAVAQYVANPNNPFVPKTREQLAAETSERFSLGRKRAAAKVKQNPNLKVYKLLENPLPKSPKIEKKTVISIASSFSMTGW